MTPALFRVLFALAWCLVAASRAEAARATAAEDRARASIRAEELFRAQRDRVDALLEAERALRAARGLVAEALARDLERLERAAEASRRGSGVGMPADARSAPRFLDGAHRFLQSLGRRRDAGRPRPRRLALLARTVVAAGEGAGDERPWLREERERAPSPEAVVAAARLEQNASVLAALERDARRLAVELREAQLLLQERASRRLAVRAAVGSLATIEPFAPVSPRHDRASEAEAEELRLAMAFPVPGAVAFDARSGKSARRGPGVAILSSELRPILAPSGGRVVFAGPFRRLGLLLIIEHAHAYHSLVLGASRLEVQVGATVAAGDIVGWLEPRPAERAELYFEVRRAGEPIAPESVLAARKGGMRG